MTINVGDRLPDVPLTDATAHGPEQTTSPDFIAGRRVALIQVPVACISVNDAFVMGAWNKADGSDDITMLADGNGAFADAVGLTMDGSKFGMGKRSQRYSMLINDGVVEQLNVEAPGEYRASSAETLLEQL